jgi:hypothetical protein
MDDSALSRIEELVHQVESLPQGAARTAAVELVRAVLDFHAGAVARMMEIACTAAGPVVSAFAADELVASLLALHGLHPDTLETRVRRAVEKLEQYFRARDAQLTMQSIEDGVVRLRYIPGPAGAGAARGIIESAIYQAAPDADGIVIEGIPEQARPGFVPLSELLAGQTS